MSTNRKNADACSMESLAHRIQSAERELRKMTELYDQQKEEMQLRGTWAHYCAKVSTSQSHTSVDIRENA